ncbi:hypothetical protein VPNG_06681 [Cytospora leucostoma]|uniref:Uncharacterized protein n=1 Tax=Cytospora leucostoma TaxID=1230097 RepID=A0A423WUI8_9PEZI|nr:hypothetical protein VPNG_06681 [Cytospora leucostoma]
MKNKAILFAAAEAQVATGRPLIELDTRAACPKSHIFGARETTASAGFGSAGIVVDLITQTYSGSTSEAIDYPACGGQSSCGGVRYADSAKQGVTAGTTAVNGTNQKFYDTRCSQGVQIMDGALCGGADMAAGVTSAAMPLSSAAVSQIKAAVFMGVPGYVSGLS